MYQMHTLSHARESLNTTAPYHHTKKRESKQKKETNRMNSKRIARKEKLQHSKKILPLGEINLQTLNVCEWKRMG